MVLYAKEVKFIYSEKAKKLFDEIALFFLHYLDSKLKKEGDFVKFLWLSQETSTLCIVVFSSSYKKFGH